MLDKDGILAQMGRCHLPTKTRSLSSEGGLGGLPPHLSPALGSGKDVPWCSIWWCSSITGDRSNKRPDHPHGLVSTVACFPGHFLASVPSYFPAHF